MLSRFLTASHSKKNVFYLLTAFSTYRHVCMCVVISMSLSLYNKKIILNNATNKRSSLIYHLFFPFRNSDCELINDFFIQ
jgi:hypothetical protein